LVVDDHDLFRAGLVSLLRAQPDIVVVGQASGGDAGVRLADELQPDVVLMDLQIAEVPGSQAMRMIVERRPSVRVIAMSVLARDEDVTGAVQAGASGYLGKDAPVGELVSAIRAAARGAAWLSPRAAEVVLGLLRQAEAPEPERASVEELSPRELDVLRLIARGLENAEIARELNISPWTAKNHVSSILTKLGLPSRVQAATCAVRHGLG
jgi:NarL family two-component system response regulator LiaR